MVMKGIIFLDVLNFFCKAVLRIENFISVKVSSATSVVGKKRPTQDVSQVHGGLNRLELSGAYAGASLALGAKRFVIRFHSYLSPIRVGTSPVHKRQQGVLSRSARSKFRRPLARGLHTQWGGCLVTAPSPSSDASHCRVTPFVESKYLRTGALVTSCFTVRLRCHEGCSRTILRQEV